MAQHALVWGSSSNVQSDPSVSAQPAQSGISTIQPDLAQELVKPEPTCLAPRATAIKEQGFSEAVAARIEAPQRGSTRSVYEAKWTIFTKWCLSNQVDFRAPPPKAIADFLLYLFQDRKLQPGTIDGTFTQFYLKDVAWADTELFHLGPVVAAQQVHHHHAQK